MSAIRNQYSGQYLQNAFSIHRSGHIAGAWQAGGFSATSARRATPSSLTRFADEVNGFHQEHLSPYLNYHRSCCYFPTEVLNAKGRVHQHYRRQYLITPYDKLNSLLDAERHLKPGFSFEQLDEIVYAISDDQATRRLKQARDELFRTINDSLTSAA